MQSILPTASPERVLLVIIALAGLVSCDSPAAVKRVQFGQDVNATAVNALGQPVALADYAGKFVWVDYAAEWCGSCRPQSKTIRSLAKNAPDGVVFLTVMTSEIGGFGHPANRETAARWANRLSLDPDRVLAANLTSLNLPQHALFTPDGREILRRTGKMSAAQIRDALESVSVSF